MCVLGGLLEISVLSFQFSCETKTALKKSIIKKKKQDNLLTPSTVLFPTLPQPLFTFSHIHCSM